METRDVVRTSFLGTPVAWTTTNRSYYTLAADSVTLLGLEDETVMPMPTSSRGTEVRRARYKLTPPFPELRTPVRVGTSWAWEGTWERLDAMASHPKREARRIAIVAKEEVKVPAGTFQTLKVVTEAGSRVISREWLAKGVGTVKFSNQEREGQLREYHAPK